MRYMRILTVAAAAAVAVAQPTAARAQVVVTSSSVQEQQASPGESYAGEIRVRNTGTTSQQVRLYQTGYLFYADGRSLHVAPDSQPRSNAGWIRMTPASLVLAAGESATVSYTVSVPPADVAAGTYWSMVMVEPVAAAAALDRSGGPGIGLRTVVRYGVQLATHVRGDAPHRLRIASARVATDTAGVREFAFELENTGPAGYRPTVSIEVFDAAGAVVATLEAQRGLLYPGTSTVQRFELPPLGAGEYEAFVVVDTGAPDVFGAQVRLNLSAAR